MLQESRQMQNRNHGQRRNKASVKNEYRRVSKGNRSSKDWSEKKNMKMKKMKMKNPSYHSPPYHILRIKSPEISEILIKIIIEEWCNKTMPLINILYLMRNYDAIIYEMRNNYSYSKKFEHTKIFCNMNSIDIIREEMQYYIKTYIRNNIRLPSKITDFSLIP